MPGNDQYDLSAYPLFRSVLGAKPQVEKQKRCFVLDPSDDANADVRQHADMLWKYIIQPAILDTDYEAHRAASASHAINQQVIDALLDDDLIIAVLSFANPRVFYETALAQAAARPMIILVEEGRELPFEPRSARVITYRLDTESVVSAVNVDRLQATIREMESSTREVCHGFRADTAALGSLCKPAVAVFERASGISYEQRAQLIREADVRLDVMGVANLGLAQHPSIAEAMLTRAGKRIEIRILQCAPVNAGLVTMIGARQAHNLDAIADEIEAATAAWRRMADLADAGLSLTIRRAQTSLPLASALITDKAVVSTPYLHSRPTAESPTLHAEAGEPYHAVMSEEFDRLWSEAKTIFRSDRPCANGHFHRAYGDSGVDGHAYWTLPAQEPARPEETSANDDGDHDGHIPAEAVAEAESPEETADGGDTAEDEPTSVGSVHHSLFGAPVRNGHRTHEANGIDHHTRGPTINARGHAIIRRVC